MKLAVPLVSQGELVGLLNLGPRLSDQDYSTDDRKLLDSLAAQAAPALQVAQLVRRQEAEARSRERIEQELRVATLIQQNFLPEAAPRPARLARLRVLPPRARGRRRLLRLHRAAGRPDRPRDRRRHRQGRPGRDGHGGDEERAARVRGPALVSPGEVLGRVNDLMCPDMPAKMFVTCLYGVLEPSTGRFRFANAGHNLPYVRTADGTTELRATGMPLGLIPGIVYEETEAILEPGQVMLLHSDGVAEAHWRRREMFGFPRLLDVVGSRQDAAR